MIPRHATWEADLAAYLADAAQATFAYGQLDCALFAAGAVQAMTGQDPAASYRGNYKTKHGSIGALKKFGKGELESTIDAIFESKPIAFAQRGDLVFYDGSVGVCIGAEAVFISEGSGLTRIPRRLWAKAWTV